MLFKKQTGVRAAPNAIVIYCQCRDGDRFSHGGEYAENEAYAKGPAGAAFLLPQRVYYSIQSVP